MEWSLDASCSVLLQYVHSHCVCLKWTVSNSWKKSFRCMCYCWSIKISHMHPDGKSLLWEQRICFALMFGSSLFLTHRSFFYAPPVLPCVTKRLTTNKSSWWKFIEMQGIRDCFLESQTLQTWCDNQLGESVGWAQPHRHGQWCPENISSFHSADIQYSSYLAAVLLLLWTLKLCSIAFSDMQYCSWRVQVSSTWCHIQGLNSVCFQISKVVICASMY